MGGDKVNFETGEIEKKFWPSILWIIILVISSIIWLCEHSKHSANFWVVTFLNALLAFCIAMLLRNWFKFEMKQILGKLEKTFPFFAIIGILVSVDSDVFTQSDGHIGNSLKRIYNKKNSIDISHDINQFQIPHLAIVLDVSESTQEFIEYQKNELKSLINKVKWQLQGKIGDTDLCQFIDNIANPDSLAHPDIRIKPSVTLYSMFKLRLFDLVSQELGKYEISITCFGSKFNCSRGKGDAPKGSAQLKYIFDYIKECEKENKSIMKGTDFIELFKGLDKEYIDLEEKADIHKSPVASFVFFSDYVHNTKNNNLCEDLDEAISAFCQKQYFKLYYCEDEIQKTTYEDIDGISVFPIINNLIRKETGRIAPLTSGNVDLSNISAETIIPIYYTYAYYKEAKSEVEITFNSLKSSEIKSVISLESNNDNTVNHHHQFYVDGTSLIASKEKALVKSKSITLSFSGRVIHQFPSHSLVFRFNDKGGYCRFDIVFFKDFPPYVRYIVSFLFIIIWLIFAIWILSGCGKKKEIAKPKSFKSQESEFRRDKEIRINKTAESEKPLTE
jgi:hypothetical protein